MNYVSIKLLLSWKTSKPWAVQPRGSCMSHPWTHATLPTGAHHLLVASCLFTYINLAVPRKGPIICPISEIRKPRQRDAEKLGAGKSPREFWPWIGFWFTISIPFSCVSLIKATLVIQSCKWLWPIRNKTMILLCFCFADLQSELRSIFVSWVIIPIWPRCLWYRVLAVRPRDYRRRRCLKWLTFKNNNHKWLKKREGRWGGGEKEGERGGKMGEGMKEGEGKRTELTCCRCIPVDTRLLKGFTQISKNVWHPLTGWVEDFHRLVMRRQSKA